jgi:hypothetical protein
MARLFQRHAPAYFAVILCFFIAERAFPQTVTLEQAQAVLKAFDGMKYPPRAEILQAKMQNLAERLPEVQAQELSKYMTEFLNEPVSSDRAYSTAHDRSAKNLERVLGRELRDPLRFADYELSRMVARRWLDDFRHNTNNYAGDFQTQLFWYSSTELRRLNLPEGLQSKPFNKDFLGTGNWVFFYVGDGTGYGRNSVHVTRSHAQETGLIFPYVMKMKDLAAVYAQSNPGAAAIAVDEDDYQKMLASPKIKTQMEEARRDLSKFMFTPDDFEKLVTAELARFLSELAQSNTEAYRIAVATLNETQADGKAVRAIVEKSFARAGIPLRYEMRIPVAIPTRYMFAPNCEERVAHSK